MIYEFVELQKVVNRKTAECLQTVHAQNNGVNNINFSSDGRKVLSSGNNYFLNEWIIGEDFNEERTIKAHNDMLTQVEYSPNGERSLTSSLDGTVKECLVENWSCVEIFKNNSGLHFNGCSFKD